MSTQKRVEFKCDICGVIENTPSENSRPKGWVSLAFDYCDPAGHTETTYKDLCGKCVHKVQEAERKQNQLP